MSETSLQPAKTAYTAADTAWIFEQARALGFDLCGVVRPERFPELSQTEEWLARGYGGEMKYLADPRRIDPLKVMAGLRSVIVCALNYNSDAPHSTEALQSDLTKERGWISRYAWGRDYHEVLGQKLQVLSAALAERFEQPFEARTYADTGPLNERVFAKYAGLGWLGKNTLLLNSKLGSWFFLGVILTTLDLAPTLSASDAPPRDLCGSCTKCIDACPTDAIVGPYVLDSRLCISYLTIELRGSIPEELREPMGRHVFGCDICQDVCPWNRRAPETKAAEFQPRRFATESETAADAGLRHETQSKLTDSAADGREPERSASALGGYVERRRSSGASSAAPFHHGDESLFLPRLEWLASLSEAQFRELFRGSAIKRTKWRGLVRNACIALGNSTPKPGTAQHQRVRRLLARLSGCSEQAIAESAQWALSRIQ